MHAVSRDVSLSNTLAMHDGSQLTALELQWELYTRARRWSESHGFESVGGEHVGSLILHHWQEVLEALERDPMELSDRLDWVAKYRLLSAYRDRHGLQWNDARLRAMDLQYHDLRPGSGLAPRLGLVELVDPSDVHTATTDPPVDTRAYFRGRCLERFPTEVVAANWDSVVFDVGGASLQRVPMMEPTKGTEAHVGHLIDSAESASDLLRDLRA
jgi:proteasome accessory factor A